MKVIVLLFVSFLFSCQSKKELPVSKSTFEFYPPVLDTSSTKIKFLEQRKHLNRIFNLTDLFTGSKDSIEIRLWPWGAFNNSFELFLFKLDNDGWHGYHYFSYEDPIEYKARQANAELFNLKDSSFIVKSIRPVCGWEKFVDSINYFRIMVLPTQSLIKDFNSYLILDGDAYQIETANKKSYRFLSYNNPSSYTYNECKMVCEFFGMLQRQFGNDYYWPQKWLYSKSNK